MQSTKKKVATTWDVVVIGGGPAGMMAAGTAAMHLMQNGNSLPKVLLLEKNPSLGKKLLITGGGRCNITNAEFDTRIFLSKFAGRGRKDDQFLFSTFSKWSIEQTLDFFHTHGLETKVEALKRVFPITDSAKSVWDVLIKYMAERKVTVRCNQKIQKFTLKDGRIDSLTLITNEEIHAHAFILATGGKSRPETGSTGDGFTWLKEFGHTISESNAALVPLTLKDTWAKDLSGVALSDVGFTVFQNGKKQLKTKGKLLFTHKGITGPTILNISRDVGELLKYGEVTIELDIVPSTPRDELDVKIHTLLKEQSNKLVKNILLEIVPTALVTPLLDLAGTPLETVANSLTREKRLQLSELIKKVPLHVQGLQGMEKAVVTSGGVALTEIDFKTMRSHIVSNLYIVGDLLNLDRPSGGYSLQICWTTGVVAGVSAATKS